MIKNELALSIYQDGWVQALAYESDGAGGLILNHDNALFAGHIERPLHFKIMNIMAGEYEHIEEFNDFFVDYGEIPDELWEAVFASLYELED